MIWARIIAESQRYAEFHSGHFCRLVGPGIAIRWRLSGVAFHRLAEGDHGHLIGMELASFGRISVPVTLIGAAGRGIVRISGFRNDRVLVAPQ